jgi:ferric iron reductase protein FhuF
VPLSFPGPQAGRQRPDHGTGPRWAGPGGACHRLVDDVISPLTVALARLAPVSPRVLWGNVASAGNSAAAQIAAQQPASAPAAWAAAGALASHPALSAERTPPGPAFRRSSCCLIYQLVPGQARAICGDCVLTKA